MTLLRFIWELPQNLAGILIYLLIPRKTAIAAYGPRRVFPWPLRSGISLGFFIFVPPDAAPGMIRHELGHTVASSALGPLYLPIVGLQSFLWAAIWRCFLSGSVSFMAFWTERWAEREKDHFTLR